MKKFKIIIFRGVYTCFHGSSSAKVGKLLHTEFCIILEEFSVMNSHTPIHVHTYLSKQIRQICTHSISSQSL